MSTKKPWFPLYAADFLTDVDGWTDIEVGIYIRLLLSQWINGPLPFDGPKLIRLCQTTPERWEAAWETLESKFEWADPDPRGLDKSARHKNRIYNPRLEDVRRAAEKISESKRRAGQASGKARKKGNGISDTEHPFSSVPTQSNQSQSQSQLQLEEGAPPPSPRPRKKATQLSPDWTPSLGLLAWAREKFPKVTDLAGETETFHDHWKSKAETRVDWDATWRNWIRKADKFRPKHKDRWTIKMANDFCVLEHLSRRVNEDDTAFIDRMRSRSERGPT